MRILNRPMFRYGGPIKEGVMHGMRNGGRTGFQDGTKKRTYKFSETPVAKATSGFVHYGPYAGMAGAYDLAAVPINTLSRMFGYNPGFSGTKFMDTLTGGEFSKRTGYDRDKAWFGVPTSAKKGWTIPSMQEGPTAAELELAKLKKELAAQKGDKPEHLGLKPYKKAAEDLAKDQQNERIQKYLKMMGYDSAKKGALSKALIDASAIVQEGTEEAGSLKEADWSKMINKAIQTTSRRLEKPEQIREAVGLMATKAAIEKDLEDPQVKALRALEIQTKEKGLDPSPADLALAASGKTGKVTQDILENIVRSNEGVENFKASFKNKKGSAYYDWLDDNKNASEMKFMKDVVSKESDFSAGFYVFPDRIVEVKDDLTMQWYY